jgi:hypothetical protein
VTEHDVELVFDLVAKVGGGFGGGDDHGSLVEDGGEKLGLDVRTGRGGEPACGGQLECGLELPEGMVLLDCSGLFPAEHGGGFKDDSAGIGAGADFEEASAGGSKLVPDVAVAIGASGARVDKVVFHLGVDGEEEVLFVAEVVVEGALGDTGLSANLIQRAGGVAPLAPQAAGR